MAVAFTGCLQNLNDYREFEPRDQYRNPGVFPGTYQQVGDNAGSRVLEAGPYQLGVPEVVRLRSKTPAWGSSGAEGPPQGQVFIPMAIWRPVGHEGRVPTIIDAGPYFEQGKHCPSRGQNPCQKPPVDDTIDYPNQITPFNLNNFLPHGYAVAQVAVRGTGTAGGCFDLMGPQEMADLDQAIQWISSQRWSNGKVALMGVSYDGSTPWIAAATGNPAVATIVPISGTPSLFDLLFHNGVSETRGPYMHNTVYYGHGFSDEFPFDENTADRIEAATGVRPSPGVGSANGRQQYQDLQNAACPAIPEATAAGQYSAKTGGRGDHLSPYWQERDYRVRVLQNYRGSVFLVHGLQDWNVDPHVVVPFNQQLRAAGIEVKELYGQWTHARPDGQANCPKGPAPPWIVKQCRLDFAEVLLRWFDKHLKGHDVDTGPSIQTQDSQGYWHNAQAFPPNDTMEFFLGTQEITREPSGTERELLLMPTLPGAESILRLHTAPLEASLRFAGRPVLEIPFEPLGDGGILSAWLLDLDPRDLARAPVAGPATWIGTPIVGHQQLNLRFVEGGDEPQPLVPGQRKVARIAFEPLDVHIPAGHRLGLWIFQRPYADHCASPLPAAIRVFVGGPSARLNLNLTDPDPALMFPVPGVHFPDRVWPQAYRDQPRFADLQQGGGPGTLPECLP